MKQEIYTIPAGLLAIKERIARDRADGYRGVRFYIRDPVDLEAYGILCSHAIAHFAAARSERPVWSHPLAHQFPMKLDRTTLDHFRHDQHVTLDVNGPYDDRPIIKEPPDLAMFAAYGKLKTLSFRSDRKVHWRFRFPKLPVFARLDLLDLQNCNEHDFVDLRPCVKLTRLWSINPATGDYKAILNLPRLKQLSLGGTLLPKLRNFGHRKVEDLSIGTACLTDIDPVCEMASLTYLSLNNMLRLERLPDPSRTKLRCLYLDAMRTISDISTLADVKTLEELGIVDCPRLDLASFKRLARHPRLQRVEVRPLGQRNRKAEALRQIFGPKVEVELGWRELAAPPLVISPCVPAPS